MHREARVRVLRVYYDADETEHVVRVLAIGLHLGGRQDDDQSHR
jgi:hypothetical protein